MIYSIVGTDRDIRDKATLELATLGPVSRHLYVEDIGELQSLIDGMSLFGETIIVVCIQLLEVAHIRDEVYDLFKGMEESSTIFIIDEPFADIHKTNRLKKVSKKLYDAKEEKVKDASVFQFCDSFLTRDKKNAWIQFLSLKEKISGESIQGALWWKFYPVWLRVKEGRKGVYSLEECERISKSLLQASVLSHRGEKDIFVELEKLVLSI